MIYFMQTTLKLLIGLFYLPILALAGLISIIRLIFCLIFVFAWDKADEWYTDMLCWINDNIKFLSK